MSKELRGFVDGKYIRRNELTEEELNSLTIVGDPRMVTKLRYKETHKEVMRATPVIDENGNERVLVESLPGEELDEAASEHDGSDYEPNKHEAVEGEASDDGADEQKSHHRRHRHRKSSHTRETSPSERRKSHTERPKSERHKPERQSSGHHRSGNHRSGDHKSGDRTSRGSHLDKQPKLPKAPTVARTASHRSLVSTLSSNPNPNNEAPRTHKSHHSQHRSVTASHVSSPPPSAPVSVAAESVVLQAPGGRQSTVRQLGNIASKVLKDFTGKTVDEMVDDVVTAVERPRQPPSELTYGGRSRGKAVEDEQRPKSHRSSRKPRSSRPGHNISSHHEEYSDFGDEYREPSKANQPLSSDNLAALDRENKKLGKKRRS